MDICLKYNTCSYTHAVKLAESAFAKRRDHTPARTRSKPVLPNSSFQLSVCNPAVRLTFWSVRAHNTGQRWFATIVVFGAFVVDVVVGVVCVCECECVLAENDSNVSTLRYGEFKCVEVQVVWG